jgi:hypothetical protein
MDCQNDQAKLPELPHKAGAGGSKRALEYVKCAHVRGALSPHDKTLFLPTHSYNSRYYVVTHLQQTIPWYCSLVSAAPIHYTTAVAATSTLSAGLSSLHPVLRLGTSSCDTGLPEPHRS